MKSYSKLSRLANQRKSVMKSLLDELILRETITTTDTKVKDLKRFFDRVVTIAKKQTLAAKRDVYATVSTRVAGEKLLNSIADRLQSRNSGYTKIVKLGYRAGDSAPLSRISINFDEQKENNTDKTDNKSEDVSKDNSKEESTKSTPKSSTKKSSNNSKSAKTKIADNLDNSSKKTVKDVKDADSKSGEVTSKTEKESK